MTSPSARDAFLGRIREAVAAGNRAGTVPPRPERGSIGYQGAGPDPVARFRDELHAAGGFFHHVSTPGQAVCIVLDLVRTAGGRRILLATTPLLDSLGLRAALVGEELTVDAAEASPRETVFAADVGISGVDHLIAETGTLAVFTRPDQPRSVSLLPPVHVVVADRSQILPDLFDLFATPALTSDPPACLSLITGPSKTGDIELKLVTGVHGPGVLHVVLVD